MMRGITGAVIGYGMGGVDKPAFLMGWEWGSLNISNYIHILNDYRREALSPSPHSATPFSYRILLSCHY